MHVGHKCMVDMGVILMTNPWTNKPILRVGRQLKVFFYSLNSFFSHLNLQCSIFVIWATTIILSTAPELGLSISCFTPDEFCVIVFCD